MTDQTTASDGVVSSTELGDIKGFAQDALPVILFRFIAKGKTPPGHKGRKAKRAAFAANLRKLRITVRGWNRG